VLQPEGASVARGPTETRDGSGVQSVERAFDVLEALAGSGGELSLSEIAAVTGMPGGSIHRLIRTLVRLGYVRQEPTRRYGLAVGLVRLGDSAAKRLGTWAQPVLAGLVEQIGESANLAILEGSHALYVAQAPGRHAMRMFTEVGARVHLHCTGVGKALLAQLPDHEVAKILDLSGMPALTDHTITDPRVLLRELAATRARGYALDEGEQEAGVSCVAVPVPEAPVLTAISFSAPAPRLTPDVVRRAVPALQDAARTLTERFTSDRTSAR
jgi:IclR family transcriptional regulator, acetate operon repressor